VRLLFASLASHGHIYPLLPLAFAARDAGHDVVFATGGDFVLPLRKAGLEAVAAGPALRASFGKLLEGNPPEAHTPEFIRGMGAQVFGEIIPRQVYADLEPVLAANRPDLVVHESMNPGAALAAGKPGIPALCHGFGRETVDSIIAGMEARFAAFAAELGVDLQEPFPFTFGNRHVDICPPSLQTKEFKAAVERIELRPVGWNEPGELPPGVAGHSRPLVYLTLGTAMGNAMVLRQAIEGLGKLPVDVLVAAGPSVELADLGDMPGNVRLEAWVPQTDLLPHVDLVVHHGGSGTTLGALAAGKPQLFLPQGADQFSNADAVVAAGAGSRLLADELTADAVTELAARLLADESAQSAARGFQAEIAAMPSPQAVVAQLPSLAG
jgi:UDP:flavonoid glycosyltransferase YjiC (YdhE family)